MLNGASVFGRTLPSMLVPRIGVFNLLMFSVTGTGVVILCMAAVKDIAGTALFAIFYGFFSGAGETRGFCSDRHLVERIV